MGLGLGDVITDELRPTEGTEGLVEWMRENLGSSREVRPIRSDDYVRASGIGYLCPREEILIAQEGILREDAISSDLQYIFNVGHGIHAAMQNHFLGPNGMITGVWRCVACGEQYGSYESVEGFAVHPGSCQECGGRELAYLEIALRDSDLRISGHLDGFHPNGTDTWEFKSINSFMLQKLRRSRAAKPEHREQALMYLHLCRINGIPVERARIVYVDKSAAGVKSAFYEVVVPWNEDEFEKSIEKVRSLRVAQSGGPVPGKICGTETCKRAQACVVAKQCFAGGV